MALIIYHTDIKMNTLKFYLTHSMREAGWSYHQFKRESKEKTYLYRVENGWKIINRDRTRLMERVCPIQTMHCCKIVWGQRKAKIKWLTRVCSR